MASLSSWGNIIHDECKVIPLLDRQELIPLINTNKPGIAYGMGRSYGDVCLNPKGNVWVTTNLDKYIEFDVDSGLLSCESGVLLRDIQRLVIPKGWMLPVTPGTQLITVGGAIANDIHGKNHHEYGTFGEHIKSLEILRTDGAVIRCNALSSPEMLTATIGGIGLTGLITKATIQLRRVFSPYLQSENISFNSIEDFFSLSHESEGGWEHCVAWIDCLYKKSVRGIFMRANPVKVILDLNPIKFSNNKSSVFFTPPISLINNSTLKIFNNLYFHYHKYRNSKNIVHYESFFYPLDNIAHWNRVYGSKGFYQYQCVIPMINGRDVIVEMLQVIANSSQGSFLSVLKTFGRKPQAGLMSFPMHGITLALDFPNLGLETRQLFSILDDIVVKAGGRIYMAKDACMSPKVFEVGYPNLNEFLKYRDPGISSALSRRLMGW